MEASHSLLSTNPPGRILLAVKRVGTHAWELCAIEVRRGTVNWCSPLSRRADVALSVVGDKAIAHDPAGYVFAYDLETGHRAWNAKLDCEIGPSGLRALGPDTAVGKCEQPSTASVDAWKVDLVAIDLKTGELRWRNAQASHYGEFYRDGEKLIGYSPAPYQGFFSQAKLRRSSRRAGNILVGGAAVREKKDRNAPVGSQNSEWTVLDALTGKALPRAVLSGAIPSATEGGAAASLVVAPLFSEDIAFFTQNREGAKPTRNSRYRDCSRQFGQGCFGTPLHSLNQVLRDGRLFDVRCREIIEIDPATKEGIGTWPITGGTDFFEPSVMALDVDSQRLTLVLASRDDLEVGRVVTFDGRRSPVIGRAPGLDPDLVALMDGILVVQRGFHLGASSGMQTAAGNQQKALHGYSVVDLDGDEVGGGPSDRARLRDLIRERGGFEAIQCSLWNTYFDARVMDQVKALPRWEEHLVSLMKDRDMVVQGAVFAAAAHLRSPDLVRALLRLVEPLPPADWRLGDRERNWWADVRQRHQWTRVRAAMILIEMKHAPAIKPLAAMMLEMPLPDYDHVADCSSFARAFCSWIEQSDLPEAKTVMAEHDRAMDAPGAWKALCESGRI
jgi:hypothetical protein